VQLPDAVRLVCDTGCATWLQFPFDTTTVMCLRPVPDSVMMAARRHRMSHPLSIDNRDYTEWRYHLNKGEPIIFFVTIGAFFQEGFLTLGEKPFVWDEPFPSIFGPPARSGHIMVCTGYGDGYLVALNSWGERWGEHGYVRIPDSTMWWACSDAYVLQPRPAPGPLAPPGSVDERSLGKDGSTHSGLGKKEVHATDSIAFRVIGPSADGTEQLIEILDAGTQERVYTLQVREDQPVTFHHKGDLYTFTYTGKGFLSGQLRYKLVENAPAELKALQEQLDVIDKQADGVIDGHW
ncbi:MAG TPA: C1 family peptidase, partial [Flavobacteriales bacterium]|nr:C1 family peptidase [Flavobacteriales bacterium]